MDEDMTVMSGREQVRRRAEQAKLLSHKFNAQAMDAQEPMAYSTEPKVQAEFERGFVEGTDILKAKQVVA